MRMRRKCNLEARLEACGEMLLYPYIEERNSKITNEIKEYIDIETLYGNAHPLELEIGCGMGGFAAEYARQNPDVNLIAVEINENVIIKAAETALRENIPNVRFLCVSANYLDRYIAAGSVERMFLNFSCPYPKNRYESHRLTYPTFLKIYGRLLKKGAAICQKTDNMHFFEYSLEQYSKAGFTLQNISLDLHNSDFEGNIVTEYEQKFASQGLPIYRVEAIV